MPKKRVPKKINQEIIKAIQFLTNQNPCLTVKLSNIVERVKLQFEDIDMDQNMNKMIREGVYNLRDLGLIGYVGYNQYCCPECLTNDEIYMTQPPPEPESQPGKLDSKYFRPYPRKAMSENKSILDPNRKRRQAENESTSSLSGNEFERTRKRFYGKKIVKKSETNPPLPGARQVQKKKHFVENEINLEEETDNDISSGVQIKEIPSSSWEKYESYVTVKSGRNDIIKNDDNELLRAIELNESEEDGAENIKFDLEVLEYTNNVEQKRLKSVEISEDSLSAGNSNIENQINDVENVKVDQECTKESKNDENSI